MKYQVILLDVDNTILDFDKAEVYALKKTCQEVGYPYSEEVLKMYAEYNRFLWRQLEQNEISMASSVSVSYEVRHLSEISSLLKAIEAQCL